MAGTGTSSLTARPSGPLRGSVRPPSDKSISHRALLFGTLVRGGVEISGLLEAEDVLRTEEACRSLGADTTRKAPGHWLVHGPGLGALRQPRSALDFGNAGTGSRLTMGVVASHRIETTFDGDASLRKRPMQRVLEPLEQMGAQVIVGGAGGRLPLTLRGTDAASPIVYRTPVASAQIKSAVLLAGLNARGVTTVIERAQSRDHTEKMLAHFGADVRVTPEAGGEGRRIELVGRPSLRPSPVHVPADPSSAAFPIVAALLIPGSDVIVEGVMMNPLRCGLLATLFEMGALIEVLDARLEGGEKVADLRVRGGALRAADVHATRAPSMIDEYPILAVAAAFANGVTRLRGLSELRVKESDRLAATSAGLSAAGVKHEVVDDDLIIEGGAVPGGGQVETHLDHRIAMSFLVLGLAAEREMRIDDATTIATSFPNFRALMSSIGAEFA